MQTESYAKERKEIPEIISMTNEQLSSQMHEENEPKAQRIERIHRSNLNHCNF